MIKANKIVVGVTGASGSIYAKLLIQELYEAHQHSKISDAALVFSPNARDVWNHEIGSYQSEKFPFTVYDYSDFFAPFASGSSDFDTLILCPCSVSQMGRIAQACGTDLISRTADVMLKEKRNLILVLRETPLHTIHIKNMLALSEVGAVILPASPSFYSHPETPEALASTVVHRILNLLQISPNKMYRWGSND